MERGKGKQMVAKAKGRNKSRLERDKAKLGRKGRRKKKRCKTTKGKEGDTCAKKEKKRGGCPREVLQSYEGIGWGG